MARMKSTFSRLQSLQSAPHLKTDSITILTTKSAEIMSANGKAVNDMRIEIEIPKEFESDYNGDMFKDFFSRVLCDIENGTMCGNYEKETAEMFLKAFDESKKAYDVDAVVAELEKEFSRWRMGVWSNNHSTPFVNGVERVIQEARNKAIDIVRNAGKDGAK